MIRVAANRADFDLCAGINNAVNSDSPATPDQLATATGMFLLHDEGGYAYVGRSSVPGSAFAMVRVLREARRHGIGAALLTAAGDAARKRECTSMWGRIREGDSESLRFAAERAFKEVTRDVAVRLEVAPGDGDAVAFVALDRDAVVGYARLYLVPTLPERLENGFTAVRKSHRRRGIATALKRAEIAWAAAQGYR